LCGQHLHNENGENYETFKAFDKPPTCLKCIKVYFDEKNENMRVGRTELIEENNELSNAFRSLFNNIIGVAQHRVDIHRPKALEGSHPFIPYSSAAAYLMFLNLKKYRGISDYDYTDSPKKFLDAGCGIGNILLIAQSVRLANRYHGLEYFDNVKSEAEHFLGLDMKGHSSSITVEKADIATYKHYGKYDFIYYYRPFSDISKEVNFESRVEDQMKVGAILIPMLKNSSAIRKDKRFKEILPYGKNVHLNNIWEKISE